MNEIKTDIVIIGAGPAGLAAAAAAKKAGASVLVLEREAKSGGILKQCIHDGFGLLRHGKRQTGPEYAAQETAAAVALGVTPETLSFVLSVKKIPQNEPNAGLFAVKYICRKGVVTALAKKVILCTGCRERTSKQIGVHGTNPVGVICAGTAQHYINLLGKMPGKRFVILGSGDIGLIMARRITLEGGTVLGVYEAKPTPSGLVRNIVQCLDDFDIPLYLSHTVTRVLGQNRLSAVEIACVDANLQPIVGTEQIIECDALVLSVGLIPENELAKGAGVQLDNVTRGAIVDQNCQTLIEGLHAAGNCLHVSDLADYVSESGETAGTAAANAALGVDNAANANAANSSAAANCIATGGVAYVVPQRLNLTQDCRNVVFYFRSRGEAENVCVNVTAEFSSGKKEIIFTKKFIRVRPPEMERLKLDVAALCEKAGESVGSLFALEFSFVNAEDAT